MSGVARPRTRLIYSLPVPREACREMTGESPGHIVYRDEDHVWDERAACDFDADEGTPVFAAADGEVVRVLDGVASRWTEETPPPADVMGTDEMGGNLVVLRHDHGEHSTYCHLQAGSILVRVGQRVSRGGPIGKVGNTGWSLGPHLHFQVQRAWPDRTPGYETLEIRWDAR